MIIDFHAYLGRWPVYPLPIKNAAGLVQRMDRAGIEVSFVSSVEGVLTWDCSRTNQQLARAVARYPTRLLPVGTVNLAVSGWAADVDEGIRRLHLADSGYTPRTTAIDWTRRRWMLWRTDWPMSNCRSLSRRLSRTNAFNILPARRVRADRKSD